MRRMSKAPSQRQLRVGEQIRHLLAELMQRGHFRDPVLIEADITVSEVRVSPDLKTATAFVLPLGGQDTEATIGALNHAGGYIRGEIGHALDLKFTPSIRFVQDQSFDEAERIETLLHSEPVARDLRSRSSEE